MPSFSITYREIIDKLLACNRDFKLFSESFRNSFQNLKENTLEEALQEIHRHILSQFNKKWQECNRTKSRFVTKNQEWLQKILSVNCVAVSVEVTGASNQRSKGGRPEKSFEDCCDRAKRYKIRHLCEKETPELICSAAHKIKNISTSSDTNQTKFTAEKALALIIDAKLSKYQYQILKKSCSELNHHIFPPYHQILDAKKKCYPNDINVSEGHGQVNLQNLLDHTATRIIEAKSKEELQDLSTKLKLISKWGCDGSSGHSEYKQQFENKDLTDQNIFLTSMVPLQLISTEDASTCWENPKPSSTKFCRPIKFHYVKETKKVINEERRRVEEEIAKLVKSRVEIDNKVFEVEHQLIFTMIDGKIAQHVTDTLASSRCYICKAKPSEMNNLRKVDDKLLDEYALSLGMSPLHARNKCKECI